MTYWLVLSAAVGAMAFAGQPPGSSSPLGNASAPGVPSKPVQDPAATSGETTPDDDFFEFLGADDVGDAELLEMLKDSPPPGRSRASPPQDSRQ